MNTTINNAEIQANIELRLYLVQDLLKRKGRILQRKKINLPLTSGCFNIIELINLINSSVGLIKNNNANNVILVDAVIELA